MAGIRVGIIGGAGLLDALGATGRAESHIIETPFGPPSGPLFTLELDGVSVAAVARHGAGHQFSPTRVPYRANLFALKVLGVSHVLAYGMVASLREHIRPRQLVIPDQVIDRTYRRPCTFYDDLVVHVEMTSPFCETLRHVLLQAAKGSDSQVHTEGTYVCIEGPAFSTRAESVMYRTWGGDLIGMTAMPEAKLAREAELHYALVAVPSDYESWQPAVSTDPEALNTAHLQNRQAANASALALIRRALPRVASAATQCTCDSALAMGIWSDRKRISNELRTRLRPLLGKYLPPEVV
ncbi:MTAP family purine nucleoside phosphorylase [Hyalangium versicolor]|uniref:MTAP family purine nucleoside phosphorylase n=1 Tax=Hyalangium versicolor TaxID=2861190 RepID=UPI001CCA6584|nr:MTAP family purine nucleoside phosphorylase [Hyalangium versicolor]